jgi:hypothetical protein
LDEVEAGLCAEVVDAVWIEGEEAWGTLEDSGFSPAWTCDPHICFNVSWITGAWRKGEWERKKKEKKKKEKKKEEKKERKKEIEKDTHKQKAKCIPPPPVQSQTSVESEEVT